MEHRAGHADRPGKDLPRNDQHGQGAIELELYPAHAPRTVNNFVFLVKEGYYDGVSFHRVINNFMIQGETPLARAGRTGVSV